MDDAFKIYVDQLRDGHTEHLNEEFSAELMDIQEEDLKFLSPIAVTGEAYLAEDELILHLNISAKAVIPCSICNEPVTIDISIPGIYHAAPFEEIKSGIYVFTDVIRESILVETPSFVECGGKCPKRKELKKYFKSEEATNDRLPPEEGQRPFAHLE